MDYAQMITAQAQSAVPGIAALLAVFVVITVAAAVTTVVVRAFSGGSGDD